MPTFSGFDFGARFAESLDRSLARLDRAREQAAIESARREQDRQAQERLELSRLAEERLARQETAAAASRALQDQFNRLRIKEAEELGEIISEVQQQSLLVDGENIFGFPLGNVTRRDFASLSQQAAAERTRRGSQDLARLQDQLRDDAAEEANIFDSLPPAFLLDAEDKIKSAIEQAPRDSQPQIIRSNILTLAAIRGSKNYPEVERLKSARDIENQRKKLLEELEAERNKKKKKGFSLKNIKDFFTTTGTPVPRRSSSSAAPPDTTGVIARPDTTEVPDAFKIRF